MSHRLLVLAQAPQSGANPEEDLHRQIQQSGEEQQGKSDIEHNQPDSLQGGPWLGNAVTHDVLRLFRKHELSPAGHLDRRAPHT